MCMAQISSETDIVEQTRVSQIAVEIISCNCFADSNAWFGFTAANEKTFAQIGRGTTADGEVYSIHTLQPWSNQYFINQYRLASKIASNQSAWAATAIAWMPLNDWAHNFPCAPSRNRGRPPKRWDQALTSFTSTYFGEGNWLKAAQSYDQWSVAESAFVKYCETL